MNNHWVTTFWDLLRQGGNITTESGNVERLQAALDENAERGLTLLSVVPDGDEQLFIFRVTG